MDHENLKQGQWYWVRRQDGTLVPYRFHKVNPQSSDQPATGQFFVGSFLQNFSLGRVVGQADLDDNVPTNKQ